MGEHVLAVPTMKSLDAKKGEAKAAKTVAQRQKQRKKQQRRSIFPM